MEVLMNFKLFRRRVLFAAALLIGWVLSFPAPTLGQAYPTKPITIICSSGAGATTDITSRAMAAGMEKLLGVPVVVENRGGGAHTVGAALVASKKPDGYTLGIISAGAITVRPHLLNIQYDPLKDFTLINQFSRYIGGLCVMNESPIKNIQDFIAYAKAHPGLSYGSSGVYTQQHLAVELLAMCKGLTFKHVPYKSGAEANTSLIGKHTDFAAGSGQHIIYVKQGVFRMILLYNAGKRDGRYPNVPTLKELGCEDAPALGFITVAPKNLPPEVQKKLRDAFKKVAESPEFQKTLDGVDLPYEYLEGAELEKSLLTQYEWYKVFLKKMGVKKPEK
jgi:tripartite-type tricarboxylate transporter receptor subunit TctC